MTGPAVPPTIRTAGPFLQLTERTWVRYDAIQVIKQREYSDGAEGTLVGSEIQVEGGVCWTEHPPERIMATVRNVSALTEQLVGYERAMGMRRGAN